MDTKVSQSSQDVTLSICINLKPCVPCDFYYALCDFFFFQSQRAQDEFVYLKKHNMHTENELAKIVFYSGLEIHKQLGPGLLESAYEECLYYELAQ